MNDQDMLSLRRDLDGCQDLPHVTLPLCNPTGEHIMSKVGWFLEAKSKAVEDADKIIKGNTKTRKFSTK